MGGVRLISSRGTRYCTFLLASIILNIVLLVQLQNSLISSITAGVASLSAKNPGRTITILKGEVIQSPEERDDLLFGKSCLYSSRGSWRCKDCSSTTSFCRPLKPTTRSTCRPFRRQSWDAPTPLSFSLYDPTSTSEIEMRTLRKAQHSKKFYDKQPLCTLQTSYCFNLSRCNDTVLTMYTNVTTSNSTGISSSKDNNFNELLLDYAGNVSSNLQRVDRFEDACLTIVFRDTYDSAQAMRDAQHWNKGKNNLLWYMNQFQFRTWTGDNAFHNFHVERAAVASEALNRPSLRSGYDQVVPLPRRWGRSAAPQQVDIHRQRKWLLSFRGSVQNCGIPYYQHRWLAATYWEDAEDVLVDVQCKDSRRRTYKKYSLPKRMYEALMWNSTFGFAPGGSGVSSYRFSELLSTATIPVVVDDLVPPFHPEIDWSGCIVRVSEARIVDLPRILRSFSTEEIATRQARCWHLHELVIGERQQKEGGRDVWKDDPRVTFTLAMEVWAARVSYAIHATRSMHALQYDMA